MIYREYRVCNRLLDVETNEHCEFDGDVDVAQDGTWRCPSCGTYRPARRPSRDAS